MKDKTAAVEQAIQTLYAKDPACVHAEDNKEVVPICAAAEAANLPAIKTLISLGVSEDLLRRNPATGYTALESCRYKMTSERESLEISGRWEVFDKTHLLIEVALKRAMGHFIGMSDEKYAERSKFGCTCGGCAGGWLSPQMRFRLQGSSFIRLLE